jgi:hypothetical protein
MKRRILTILWPLLISMSVGFPCLGQIVLGPTTLTNAIKLTDTHIVLGSGAGITAPGTNKTALTNLMIDGEMFEVLAIDPPGTNYLHVVRAVRQSLRTTHQAGATVWAGPTASFLQSSPAGQTCTRGALPYVPMIEIATHDTFDCLGGVWVRTSGPDGSYNGTAIASATSATVTPPAQTFKISGTSAITTIATPAGWVTGLCLNIIPTGNFTTSASGGNIGKASTAVTGRVLKLCLGNLSLWYPSY